MKLSCQGKIHIWGKYWIWTWRYLDYKFGLRYILLDLEWKSFGQRFINILIRYFIGAGLGNTWTANLDYKCYILRDLDFKVPGLRIWFSIVIYLTFILLYLLILLYLYLIWITIRKWRLLRLLLDLDLEVLGLWFRITINLICL